MDYWRVRQFLVESYPIGPPCLNWEPRRWDGWFWHQRDRGPARKGPQPDAGIWSIPDGRVVAAVVAEDGGDAHLQVHPDQRDLEPELVAWAEAHLARTDEAGRPRLDIPVLDDDRYRRALLEGRGYQPGWGFVTRRRTLRLGEGSPPPRLPDGYRLRALRPGDPGDHERVAAALNTGFGRDCHTAAEFAALEPAPSFRADLHLVAEAADGSFAAFVGLALDRTNHRAVVEPVCTDPAHRRRGLAAALLAEGIQRVAALGAQRVYVGTGTDPAANALYAAAGFTEVFPGTAWRRGPADRASS